MLLEAEYCICECLRRKGEGTISGGQPSTGRFTALSHIFIRYRGAGVEKKYADALFKVQTLEPLPILLN